MKYETSESRNYFYPNSLNNLLTFNIFQKLQHGSFFEAPQEAQFSFITTYSSDAYQFEVSNVLIVKTLMIEFLSS